MSETTENGEAATEADAAPNRPEFGATTIPSEELEKLTRPAEIYITHLKPGEPDLIMQEIAACARRHAPRMLRNGQVFEL